MKYYARNDRLCHNLCKNNLLKPKGGCTHAITVMQIQLLLVVVVVA